MRKKSEKKRQEILDVAVQVFHELGFERTSMSEISARIGGSKTTLYNYFPSKEELFFEVIFLSLEKEFEAAHAGWLDPAKDDIRGALLTYGQRGLTLGCSPEIIAALRLAIAEAKRANLGPMCYEKGLQRGETLFTEFLRNAMAQGKLRTADPKVAAQHFRGLLEAELLMRFLYGVQEIATASEIREVTQRAVDVFMAAYGNQANAGACHSPD